MKLTNSLNIKHLLETDWANQFNGDQLELIRRGLNSGLNVEAFANPEFNYQQMTQISDGYERH